MRTARGSLRWFVCAVAWLPVATPGLAEERPARRFALVIGNNEPEPGAAVSRLRYADDDALSIAALLEEAGVRTAVFVRPDGDTRRQRPGASVAGPPRWSAIERQFKRWAALMAASREPSELIVFFSGHGDAAHGEGYVVLEDRRLTRQLLYGELLARSPAAANHVIIDACKSYLLALRKGPGGARRPYTHSFADHVSASARPIGFVLSTSSGRDSHEYELYQAGVFTHELRSALRGAADVDRDRRITYAELGAFLTSANAAVINPRFRPDFAVLPPGGGSRPLDRAVLEWRGGISALQLDGAASEHLVVEGPQGERVLDVHPAPGQALQVHLPAERPLFVRDAAGERELAIEQLGSARLSELTARPLAIARKGALQLALRALFSAPFGRADVERFRSSYGASDPLLQLVQAEQAGGRLERRRGVWRTVRTAAGWSALVSLSLAVGLHAWSFERHLAAKDAPQRDRPDINGQIGRLNGAVIGSYALAALAGASWLALRLLGLDEVQEVRAEAERTSTR